MKFCQFSHDQVIIENTCFVTTLLSTTYISDIFLPTWYFSPHLQNNLLPTWYFSPHLQNNFTPFAGCPTSVSFVTADLCLKLLHALQSRVCTQTQNCKKCIWSYTGWSQSLCAPDNYSTKNAKKSDCLSSDRQGQGDTSLTLTPSFIPNSNYVIMVNE
jgi:hypothetical protein